MLDSGASSTITVGNSANARTINIGNVASTAQTVVIGSATNTTSSTTIQGGNSSTSAIVLQTGNNGATAGGITIGNTTGAFTQAIAIGTNATASSTTNVTIGSTVAGATTLQSAGGTSVNSISTTNVLTVTGTANPSAGTNATIVVNNNATTPSGNLLALQNKGTNKFTVDVNGAVIALGNTQVQQTGTGAATIVNRTDGVTASLKAGLTKSTFVFDSTGTFGIAFDSRANILAGTGSGTDAITILGSGNVGISNTNPQATLSVGTGDLFQVAGASGNFQSSGTGSINTNNTVAFQVQSATSVKALTADTSARRITIGTPATPLGSTSANGDLVVVGNAEVQGNIYFGTAAGNIQNSGSGGSLRYSGTARNTKTIALTPEFAGLALSGSGIGTLTSGVDTTAGAFKNYYNWTTTQSSAQSYDMYVRVPVPRDFGAFPASPQICYNVWSDDASPATVNTIFYDTGSSPQSTFIATPTATSTWQQKCTSSIGGTVTVNGNTYWTVRITLNVNQNKNLRIGDITFDYLSTF